MDREDEGTSLQSIEDALAEDFDALAEKWHPRGVCILALAHVYDPFTEVDFLIYRQVGSKVTQRGMISRWLEMVNVEDNFSPSYEE